MNFAGDAAIKIGGVEGSDKEAYYVRAITAMTNSTVNVVGDAIFELEGSDTIGLDLSDNSAVNVDGNVVTSAKATTGSVKGIELRTAVLQSAATVFCRGRRIPTQSRV